MAANVTYPSAKQFIGVAKETTPGTPVAMTFTMPVDNFDPEDKVTPLIDGANRGSMTASYNWIPGAKHSEWTLKGPAFFDGLGFWLNNILGDLSTTGASPPYTHAFSLLNSGTAQPGTLTITDWQGLPATTNARQLTGCVVSELTLTGNAESELIMVEVKGVGWASNIAGAAPTSAPTTAMPLASWRSLVGIGGPASGGTQDSTVGDWEIKITRKIKQIWTAQNSQNPWISQRGEVDVSMKLDFAAPAAETNNILMFLNNTQPILQLLMSNGGSGASLLSLQADFQVGAFDTSKIDRGNEAVAIASTIHPMANTTNAGASGGSSPIKITLQNAIASGIF